MRCPAVCMLHSQVPPERAQVVAQKTHGLLDLALPHIRLICPFLLLLLPYLLISNGNNVLNEQFLPETSNDDDKNNNNKNTLLRYKDQFMKV